MAQAHFLPLTLLSGIPVLELAGEWGEAQDALLAETVRFLAHAGHTEIVLSLARMALTHEEEAAWRERAQRLSGRCARRVRLELVCPDAARPLRAWSRRGWAVNEEQAVCRLKGVSLAPCGTRHGARLAH